MPAIKPSKRPVNACAKAAVKASGSAAVSWPVRSAAAFASFGCQGSNPSLALGKAATEPIKLVKAIVRCRPMGRGIWARVALVCRLVVGPSGTVGMLLLP